MTITGKQVNGRKSISVVIASVVGGSFIDNCLESLGNQKNGDDVEVIVVDRSGNETANRIRRKFPRVNVIQLDPQKRLSIPELRKVGAKCAQGDIVAIIEEHKTAAPDWIDTIRTAFREGDAAIGGPILDDNYSRLPDWVVYLTEYHNYLPPWQDGERYVLNTANIAYDRHKLLEHEQVLSRGYWEVVLHPLLSQMGKFRAVPKMVVRHTGPYNYGNYLRQRYSISRAWGGVQSAKTGIVKRLAYLVAAPVLPVLLLGKIASKATQSKRLTRKFIAILPMLIPVFLVYVCGEWSGYLVGAGKALDQVE